jgi:hypothetical protein
MIEYLFKMRDVSDGCAHNERKISGDPVAIENFPAFAGNSYEASIGAVRPSQNERRNGIPQLCGREPCRIPFDRAAALQSTHALGDAGGRKSNRLSNLGKRLATVALQCREYGTIDSIDGVETSAVRR